MAHLDWKEKLKNATKSWKDDNGRRLVHYEFQGGDDEMLEEYDLNSSQLVGRRYRHRRRVGVWEPWVYEIGEEPSQSKWSEAGLHTTSLNPVCVRRDGGDDFIWRIRNLPGPVSNYSVQVEPESRRCTVCTENRKYYKLLTIPDMDRLHLPLEPKSMSFSHSNNTLVIKYRKPDPIRALEASLRMEMRHLPERNQLEEEKMMRKVGEMMQNLLKT